MCLDLGLSKSTLSDLKYGRTKGMSTATAQKIASYLGVTVGYLLGEEDMPQNEEKPTNPKIGELSEEELEIIEDLRRLAQADQDAILRMIRSLSGSAEK